MRRHRRDPAVLVHWVGPVMRPIDATPCRPKDHASAYGGHDTFWVGIHRDPDKPTTPEKEGQNHDE